MPESEFDAACATPFHAGWQNTTRQEGHGSKDLVLGFRLMEEEKKVYSRKYYPLVIPADPALPIYQGETPEPFRWGPGVEELRVVNGQQVVMVRLLAEGIELPLSELLVMPDPMARFRKKPPQAG